MAEHITDWEKFLVNEIFNVTKVDITTETVRVRTGPIMVGGHTSTSSAGHSDSMEIYVESENTPVKKLEFLGIHPIEMGHTIRAHIIAAHEYTFYAKKGEDISIYDDRKRTAYKGRELEETETAYKIEKLDEHGDVLFTCINPVIVKYDPKSRF